MTIRVPHAHGGLAVGRSAAQASVALDEVDLALLTELVTDARVSQRGLGRRVGMSPPAVGERITRLERLGVIRGYRAEIDFGRLGSPLLVYLGIVAVQGLDQATLVDNLGKLPEVESVDVITGPLDLLVRVRVRDHEHLRELLFDRVWGLTGVDRTETLICLDSMAPKDFSLEFLAALREDKES